MTKRSQAVIGLVVGLLLAVWGVVQLVVNSKFSVLPVITLGLGLLIVVQTGVQLMNSRDTSAGKGDERIPLKLLSWKVYAGLAIVPVLFFILTQVISGEKNPQHMKTLGYWVLPFCLPMIAFAVVAWRKQVKHNE